MSENKKTIVLPYFDGFYYSFLEALYEEERERLKDDGVDVESFYRCPNTPDMLEALNG